MQGTDRKSRILRFLVKGSAAITVGLLVVIVGYILLKGLPNLTPQLFAKKYTTENVSLLPALINTLYMTAISLAISVPLGVASAVFLVEYAKKNGPVVKVIKMTVETLSGIPSIVYGLFGMLFFVKKLGLGTSLISGALTLSIMILPLIIRTTQEALLSVDPAYREASFGLGAGKLHTIFKIVLPNACVGILSGVVLSIGRIVGETAALIYTSGTVSDAAGSLSDSARTLAVHMYALSAEGMYVGQTYATAVVLLVLVGCINAMSDRLSKKIGRINNK